MAEAKLKRRWFRFSLRTLFVLATALTIWLGLKINAAREQRFAVAAVRALGGHLRYDFEFRPDGSYINPGPTLSWWERLLGLDFFHNVVEITVSVDAPDSEDYGPLLPHLPYLKHLRDFRIERGNFVDDDFRYLANLTELEIVGIADNPIGGEGFQYLSKLKKLKNVIVIGPTFGDAGAARVATLSRLTSIRFAFTKVTDAGVRHIESIRSLRSLSLIGSTVTDKCIDTLARLPELKEVFLENTQISHDGIRKLQQLRPSLQISWSSNQPSTPTAPIGDGN